MALQISREMVPDLDTANIEHFKISDFIFSSDIDPQLVKPSVYNLFCIYFNIFINPYNLFSFSNNAISY